MTEEKLSEFFGKEGIKATINYYTAKKRKICFATIGADHLPAILFIHGAPASMTIYRDYYKDNDLLNTFSMYGVDRPGFGVTGGQPDTSIYKQAEMIFQLAERIHRIHQPLIVMAGSYGASIACRLVMDHPGIVQGLVLVAPSLGPGLEKMYWLSPLLDKTFLKNFVSREYRSASAEKMDHKKELQKMLPLWPNITIPVYYLQSKKDSVVDASNAEFAKQHLTNTALLDIHLFKGRKHNIDSKHFKEIKDKIFRLYNRLKLATQHRKNT
jgi:pimeloyl-ACP methyl ester carboxylesterase